MEWIKYQIQQTATDGSTSLISKRLVNTPENLNIADAEAYNGYTIESDSTTRNTEPLSVKHGGTGIDKITLYSVLGVDSSGIFCIGGGSSGAVYKSSYSSVPTMGTLPASKGGTGYTSLSSLRSSGLGISDYVTAYGTSGIWNYRKYNSKRVEMWAEYETTLIYQAAAYGWMYGDLSSHYVIYRYWFNTTFPFTFSSRPMVLVEGEVRGDNSAVLCGVYNVSTTGCTPTLYSHYNSSSGEACKFFIYVAGTVS